MSLIKTGKSFKKRTFFSILTFAFLFILFSSGLLSQEVEKEKISRFGEYKGYSEIVYDSWLRSSRYLTMRDGVKLAIDILRPAKNGIVEKKPLPVLWMHTRYRRAYIEEGKIVSIDQNSDVRSLLKHGYIVAAVDVRGSGASFDSKQAIFDRDESQDAYEVIEWLASQPWCDGNIGMFGGSYLGITQLMAASTKPPHLKAIFPMVALFDLYNIVSPGGVVHDDFIKTWSELTKILDLKSIAAPVDEDKDKILLNKAIQQHKQSRGLWEIMKPLPYRNLKDEVTGDFPLLQWHPSAFVEEINESEVPMYFWCGWFDSFTKDGFLMYRNFDVPRKMVIGAWSHSPRDSKILEMEFKPMNVETIRWFDYWLKGIDNGIMDEDSIRYQVMKTSDDYEWRTSTQWPLPEEKKTLYFFHSGPSGSIDSVNDGILNTEFPKNKEGFDSYKVDYSTSTGTSTRWDNAVGGDFGYPDMTENDQKALTYTTAVLTEDIEVTGHIIVHLWISSTAKDGNFFAYLEEVDSEGFSHYITEGKLRASYRRLHEPPYDNLGLPYHRSFKEDFVELTPGKPTQLVFDMHPTSNIFNEGNRIRIAITCADKDNTQTIPMTPPPSVSVYHNKKHASHVILPVISKDVKDEFSLSMIIILVLIVVVLVIAFWFYFRKRTGRYPPA